MKYGLYQIWDHHLEMWSPIYVQRNERMALKGVEELINGSKTPFSMELSIYKMADFDDEVFDMPITNISKTFLKTFKTGGEKDA